METVSRKKSRRRWKVVALSSLLLIGSAFLSRQNAKGFRSMLAERESSHEIMQTQPVIDPIYNKSIVADPWKSKLYQRLDRVRAVCGKLCRINTVEEIEKLIIPVEGSAINMLRPQPVDCPAILASPDIDASDHSVPDIPEELLIYFTLGGHLKVRKYPKRSDIFLGGASETSLWKTGNVWKVSDINNAVREAKAGVLKGSYGVNATRIFMDVVGKLPLKGKSLLVIGSSHPWVEAVLLAHGAAKITTLEYGEIISEHPQLKTLTPSQFRQQYREGKLELFDGVISHSSVEHSGLGRYGDALNPWGDILTVARAWCVVKEDGFMYLALPTGNDHVMSNWHRTYGKYRWPLVTINWKPFSMGTDGAELRRNIWASQDNGGFGYLFTRVSPKRRL